MMQRDNIFLGRKLVIATMHGKEAALAPVLEEKLGVHCMLPVALDTDCFGTFDGSISRRDDTRTTLINKCRAAMELTGCDLALGSEGSFGPHPEMAFLPCGLEELLLLDMSHNLSIHVAEVHSETNFSHARIRTWKELQAFAEKAMFPSHALILKTGDADQAKPAMKGINDPETLKAAFDKLIGESAELSVQTDMRAMHNPTRMRMIGKTALSLAEKALNCCPSCHTPGFGMTGIKRGLPCAWCGAETHAVLSKLFTCAYCGFEDEQRYPGGQPWADPMHCPGCNP